MSASPVETQRTVYIEVAFKYLLAALLCALFGAVYEAFSHGVYAYGMLYAFLFPLAGGVLPALLLLKNGRELPSETARQLWHFGISAFTVGSLFSGALEIYGTSSRLTSVYWMTGGACLMLAVLIGVLVRNDTQERAVNMGM